MSYPETHGSRVGRVPNASRLVDALEGVVPLADVHANDRTGGIAVVGKGDAPAESVVVCDAGLSDRGGAGCERGARHGAIGSPRDILDRTGDICTQITGPCSCGRNTMRLSPIIGRKNQMIKLKGTTIFPPAIEDALHLVSGIADYIIEVARDEFNLDRVTIHILPAGESNAIEAALKAALQSKLRVIPDINFVDAGSLAKMRNADSRKPVRVVFR